MATTKVPAEFNEAAQTTVTSLLATDIKIGEDDQTKVDFETADTINFYAGNEKQLILTDGALTPGSNAIVDLGTDALEFKDAYFDGTVEADAITVGGTNISSTYGVIADSSSIVTTGAVNAGSITSGFVTIDTGSSNISTTGTLTGGPLVGSSLTMGSAAISEADIEQIDDLTAGTVVASKAVVVDGSKNIATLGTVGCGAITSTGSSSFATSVKTPLIEFTDGDDAITIADGGKVTFGAAAVGKQHEPSAGTSLQPDFDIYQHFLLDANGNFTLTNPNNTENVGQSGVFMFSHNGGARTLSIGTEYMVPGGGTGITLSTGGAGVVDIIPYYVYATNKVVLGKPQLDVKD